MLVKVALWLAFIRQRTQPTFTWSKLTIETLEQRCEIGSKLTIKPPKWRHCRLRREKQALIKYWWISELIMCVFMQVMKTNSKFCKLPNTPITLYGKVLLNCIKLILRTIYKHKFPIPWFRVFQSLSITWKIESP